ncbi:MAG TPA: RES family NAD+ phosphorylase [Opitutaceae bacterium]|nr:RES family NAD+ phosphorylase [Opitutaceae bacterium]
MPALWRVEKAEHASVATKGLGAFNIGGRWNRPGRYAIYAAEHLSLALLEILVHAPDPEQRKRPRVRFRLTIAPEAVEEIALDKLPRNFGPATPFALTQDIGDPWLDARKSVALKIPSAIVPVEFNYVINPLHPDFASAIKWEKPSPLILDERLTLAPAPAKSSR